jgi:predicted nucleic acid-binding protein
VNVVYDAGALIAAERGDPKLWTYHRARLERGEAPWTTAPVVAQVSRSPNQARLRLLLGGCHIAAFDPGQAHAVGALLARAGTADVVDAHVVVTAAARAATVLSSDTRDVRRLARCLPTPVPVKPV